jgi:ferrochelatase
MTANGRRIGIVLFQLGGPENLDAIEPFLYNLFCDPDIIDFPGARLGRKPLAKLISATRARKVRHHYAEIGGGSPIRRHTEAQAAALERRLRGLGVDARCFVAMRYWRPFTAEAVAAVRTADCDELVLLPLYTQYSSTTTGSIANEWDRRYVPNGARVHRVADFYRNQMYIDGLVERINQALARFPDDAPIHLVFSAHGVPLAVIENGDPYQRQIEATVSLVMQAGGWAHPHRLCYQSKVGASKWLAPALPDTLRLLAVAGAQNVCVVPVAFVSDHVETLGEIDHDARKLATRLGISHFEMVAGLNDSPKFIEALAQIVLDRIRVSEGVQHTPVPGHTPTAEMEVVAAESANPQACWRTRSGIPSSTASLDTNCGAEPRTLHGHP